MMASLGLLLGSVLLVLGCGALWRTRRRTTRGMDVPPVAAVATTSAVGATVTAQRASVCRASVVAAPDGRVLLRRLVAFAFDDDGIDGAVPNGQAALLAEAEALLARLDAQPRYMPRRPQLLPQLMRALNDPDAQLASIARIIAQDPTLSANLLRVANSAFYRVSARPVESIDRAITMLGFEGLRPVIAAALVQPVMGTGDGAFGRLPSVIWDHTLLSAAAAADYARRVEHDDAFAAQLLGLLHGLGAIIVVQVLRDVYARHADLTPDARVVAHLLDAWSGPTARRVAHGWGLSERMAEALIAQQGDALPVSPLGRALRVGRTAGALALLCRAEAFDDDEGVAMLAALDVGDVVGWEPAALWPRLRA